MHRFVHSRSANVPPVSKPKPAWRRMFEEGFSESSATDNSRILNGWTKEAAGRFNGRSSKGLVLFCIDVSGSMRSIKDLHAQYVVSIIKMLSAISNGLNFGVVFYTDYDGYRSSPVVWSPMSLEWGPEKLASFIRNSIVEGGGGTNCESFDVAFNYILREIVPFYRQTGAANSPVLVINLTDEDMRVFTREYSNDRSTYSHLTDDIKGPFSYGYMDTDPSSSTELYFSDNNERARNRRHMYPQTEELALLEGPSSNGRVHADSIAECVGALNEYIARWGGRVATNGELREMCFENNVHLRIIKFDRGDIDFRGEVNHAGYADLCKDSFDRIQLFKCKARSENPERVNLPGFISKMIERFFKSLTHDLSSSFMLGIQQDVINKNQVNPNNVISKTGCFDCTQAQVEDLKNRVMDKNSKDRTGIFILDNSTGKIDYQDNQIFLSSHCDGHVFTHTLLATPGSEVGTYEIDNDAGFAEGFKKYDRHMASILSKMIKGDGTHRDVVDFIYGEIGEDASDENCCKVCIARTNRNKKRGCYPTTMDTKTAIAKYFAIKLFKTMIGDSNMVTCCSSILDVVGAIYAFVCSAGTTRCGMVNRILGEFCTAFKDKGDFIDLLRENKHVNDVNHDTVSRINCRVHKYVMDEVENEDNDDDDDFRPDFWMYLRDRETIINHANAIIKKHTLDKYKTFEDQDCYDLVETVVKKHLVVAKQLPEFIKEEVKNDGVIDCERLLAIPVMASSPRSPTAVGDDDNNKDDDDNNKDDGDDNDNDGDDNIFSLKLAIAYIMSLVGRKFSIQRPKEISGLKSVIAAAAAAASVSSTPGEMSSVDKVLKRLCKEYFVEWIDERARKEGWPTSSSSLDFHKLLFEENGEGCVRNNLTNWPCLNAIQKAALLYFSDDNAKFVNTVRLYKLLKNISNPDIFEGVTRHSVYAFEFDEVDSEECALCENVCSKNTEIVGGGDGKRYCVWCLDYTLNDGLGDKIFRRIADKMMVAGVLDGEGDAGVRSSESRKRRSSSGGGSSSGGDGDGDGDGGGARPRIERRREAVVGTCMTASRFNPGLIGKWKICESDDGMEEAFKADYTLKGIVEKLMEGNIENRKEAAVKILQDYMNTGKGPVSLDVAGKVCSTILKKSFVSKYIEAKRNYTKIRDELGSADYTYSYDNEDDDEEDTRTMVMMDTSLVLKCSNCGCCYKGSMMSPVKSRHRRCPLCRAKRRLPAEFVDAVVNVSGETSVSDAEKMWFLGNVEESSLEESGPKRSKMMDTDDADNSIVIGGGGDEETALNVLAEGAAGDGKTDSEDEEDEDLMDMIKEKGDVDGDDQEDGYEYMNGMIIKRNSGELFVKKVKLHGFSGFGSMKVRYMLEGGETVNPFKDVMWTSFVDTMVIQPLYEKCCEGEWVFDEMIKWKSSFSAFVSTQNHELWQFAKDMSVHRTSFQGNEVSRSIVDAAGVRKLVAKM